MPNYSTGDIRNVAFVGHMGTGKTTLIDTMLFSSGAVSRQGSVNDGTSNSDFEKEEKEHKHSIFSSILRCEHLGRRINVIDTPGSPDLMGQSIACLPAVEVAMVAVSAVSGIELITRRMMEMCKARNIPRAMIITKLDAPEIKLGNVIDLIKATFGRECLPINLPAQGGKAVVDCLVNGEGDSDLGAVADFHSAVMDQIVELDEALMEQYLGGETITPEALHSAFVQALVTGHLVPILFVGAKVNVGVKELMDVVANHFPSPLERPSQGFLLGAGEAEQAYEAVCDSSKTLLAHVFKVTTDPFIGKLSVFRVHQGQVTASAPVLAGDSRKALKLNRVFTLNGKEQKELDVIISGDIGAVAKVEDLHIGDIMHEDHALDTLHIDPLPFPQPMFRYAVAPKNRGDEAKISSALARLTEEDPTFRAKTDSQTKELVISGLGELHLRFLIERLKNRGLEMETRTPKTDYRETITMGADGHHRHKKQTGGAGQFGEVFLKVEPLERGAGYEFVDAIFGGSIPGQFMPAVEKGVKELLEEGVVGGYPIQDIRVTITDGKSHPVDSKEIAFKTAGKYAVRDAIQKAKPVLLEPIVKLEVTVPDEVMGTITGDLSQRRGRVQGTEPIPGGFVVVKANAPLEQVANYQNFLTGATGGQGSFMMEFSHYEVTPSNVQAQIAALFKPRETEE